jgi:sugar/nucleoside kinase (ribokinase family)
LPLAPAAARVYVSVGDIDARALAGRELPPELATARAMMVNEKEALVLTGAPDAESAAAQLARHAPLAIVTLGPDGALAVGPDGTLHVPGVTVEPVVDTTGAGDLFAAAYIWADHWGAPLEERLRWAVLYASASVRVATATAGALTPVRQPSTVMKEEQ